MATIKSSATTFTREYTVGDPDDKASIKLRLSVPFDLPPRSGLSRSSTTWCRRWRSSGMSTWRSAASGGSSGYSTAAAVASCGRRAGGTGSRPWAGCRRGDR